MSYRQQNQPETSLEKAQKKRFENCRVGLTLLVLGLSVLLLCFVKLRYRDKEQAMQEIDMMQNLIDANVFIQPEEPVSETALNLPEPFQTEALQELENYVEAQQGQVSVWLKDLNSGEIYYHDEGGYYCASTLKAPYALWLCLQDEQCQIDLSTELKGQTGWELLHDMIAQSSNDATRALCAKWPGNAQNGFGELLRQIGFSAVEGCEISLDGIYGWISAQDGGMAMQALYSYFETETENSKKLEQAFLDADHDLLWSPSPAAKKYGSWDNAFHDMMIVYGQKPYILTVFSNWGIADVNFPKQSTEMMQQIGKLAAAAVGASI